MTIRAVLFDLDDTIIDHKNSFQAGLRQVRDAVNVFSTLPLDEFEDLYQSLLEDSHQYVLSGEYTPDQARYERFKALFKHVNYEATRSEIEEVKTLYKTTSLQAEQLISGVFDLIQTLRNDSMQIGLVTNHTSDVQRAKLQRHALEPMFDVIAISGEVGIAKPNREIFEFALNKLNRKVDEVIMVGDSWESDILGATSIGMRAVWLNRYNKNASSSESIREINTYIPLGRMKELLLNW